MSDAITWLTLRVCVKVPMGTKRPTRVRVLLKERGARLFPFQQKLATIPLCSASWRLQKCNMYYNEQAKAVPLKLHLLVKRAERQPFTLQFYCQRGSTDQHKAFGSFLQLLQQVRDNELVLRIHYPGCAGQKEAVSSWVPQHLNAGKKTEQHEAPSLHGDEPDSGTGLGDEPDATRDPRDADERKACEGFSDEGLMEELWQVKEDYTAALQLETTPNSQPQREPSPPPRPVRFRDSGSAFVEMLQEYDRYVAEDEMREAAAEAKKAAEEIEAAGVRAPVWQRVMAPLRRVNPPTLLCLTTMVFMSLLFHGELQLRDWVVGIVGATLILAGYLMYKGVVRRGAGVEECGRTERHDHHPRGAGRRSPDVPKPIMTMKSYNNKSE